MCLYSQYEGFSQPFDNISVSIEIMNGNQFCKASRDNKAERAAAASNTCTHVLHRLICDKCIQFALRNPHNHYILVRFQRHNWLNRAISGTPQRFQSGYVFLCHLILRIPAQLTLYVRVILAPAKLCLSERAMQIGIDVPFIDFTSHDSAFV